MLVPSKRDCECILRNYGIRDDISSLEIVSSLRNANKVIVCKAGTRRGLFVIKLREEHYRSQTLVKSQTDFAEALSRAGLRTARHYSSCKGYTTLICIAGRRYVSTVEDYIGSEGLSTFNDSDAYHLGRFLGELHSISLGENLTIGKSFITDDMRSGKADLRRVFRRRSGPHKRLERFEKCFEMHDSLLEDVMSSIDVLPASAVHGDIGATNNIVPVGDRWGLFDFDNAGDEVLLVDFFATWYGSIRCLRMSGTIDGNNQTLLLSYIKGYTSMRNFSEPEIASAESE